MESQSALIEQSFDARYSRLARDALDDLPDNFTITDPCIGGHPIVFGSRGFLKMSGYAQDEVVGRNGKIFQGPCTDQRSVMEIREAIREERPMQISLLNYRKDGTPLWMLFHMSPDGGAVAHFVAVQVPISRRWRLSCSANGRNGVNPCEEVGGALRDVVLGSCRREVCSDDLAELGRISAFGSVLDLDSRDWFVGKDAYTGSSPLSSSVFISLGRIKQSFVLTDVNLPDMPIVYASDAFLKLTGYSRHEVLGWNCRFLNGMDTDSSTLFQIFVVRRGNFLFVMSIGSFGGNGNIEGVMKSCRIELLYGQ
ncbi:hypothetical protein BT93_E2175 [Corymbia citriodora subsp. variegata]|nr:hypothetical protein BT93_E2175 [Corymbia citriodora subsp. variegata]